ncbi:ribonuclease T2 [Neocallimastix lanati (nom. inval.)]|nr:ribonuclease T2 [Neocallimastix sp. JGI-2020a]
MTNFIIALLSLFFIIQIYGRVLDSHEFISNKVKNVECPTYDIVACSGYQGLVNKCCVPDQGHLILSLQWLPSYCKNAGRNKPCKKGTLKKVEKDTWTLHGLWPGNCDGVTYLTNCNPEREEENIEEVIRSKDEDLLSEMEKIWLSGNPDPLKDNNWFWAHEWNKHGQCVSTITPQCIGTNYKKDDDIISYFEKAVELRSIYDLYPILEKMEILPNDKDGYNLDTLQNAFKNAFNNTQVEINCVFNKHEKRQYMSEVRLCFHAKNAFEVEGPIDCINAFSKCNPKYKVFYAVNPTKSKAPKAPENDDRSDNSNNNKNEDYDEDIKKYGDDIDGFDIINKNFKFNDFDGLDQKFFKLNGIEDYGDEYEEDD